LTGHTTMHSFARRHIAGLRKKAYGKRSAKVGA